jgi:hypothetical protein
MALVILSLFLLSVSLVTMSLFANSLATSLIFALVFFPCRRLRAPPISGKVKVAIPTTILANFLCAYACPLASWETNQPFWTADTLLVTSAIILIFISGTFLKKFRMFVTVLIGTAAAAALISLDLLIRFVKQGDGKVVSALLIMLTISMIAYFYGLLTMMGNSISVKKCIVLYVIYLLWIAVYSTFVARSFRGFVRTFGAWASFIATAVSAVVLIIEMWPFSESAWSAGRMKSVAPPGAISF